MGNAYTEHADNEALYHNELKGEDNSGGSTLTLLGVTIPCTIDRVRSDWMLTEGKSQTTIVDECEFLVSDVPANIPGTSTPLVLKKGILCQLKLNPNSVSALRFQLWEGGFLAGGLVYRFTLVDENFKL